MLRSTLYHLVFIWTVPALQAVQPDLSKIKFGQGEIQAYLLHKGIAYNGAFRGVAGRRFAARSLPRQLS